MENIGRLLSGGETTFHIPYSGAYRLDIGWVFARVAPHHQTLELALNGRKIGSVQIKEPCSLEFFAPEVGTLLVTLPEAMRPIDVGAGPDTRTLSVGFSDFQALHKFTVFQGLRVTGLRSDAMLAAAGLTRASVASAVESLGDNCELGMVQRELGVDPLGLFRFSSTTPEVLVRALKGKLAGLGAPGTLNLSLLGERGEYMVHDRSYGLLYHTWLFADSVEPERVLKQEYTRLAFLSRMFLERATAGEVLYVFRDHGQVSYTVVEELLAALKDFGPNELLVVRQSDSAHPADSFDLKSSGVAYAWVDYRGPDWWMIAETWVSTLIRAQQMRGKVLPIGLHRGFNHEASSR